MAGIYQRDNYGAQLQAALAGAFDRRLANRQREDERRHHDEEDQTA